MDVEQTQRTKSKLDESTDLLMAAIVRCCGSLPTVAEQDEMRQTVYNALSWTADDVLRQCVEGKSA